MMNDFQKFATGHMGISSMVLDDVMRAQNHYLNPYILEERQLNVTQMDVFSRLMADRIIFLGTEMNIQLTRFRHSCCISIRVTTAKTLAYISTVQVAAFMPVLVFTIPCSLSKAMWPPSAQAVLLPWLLCCLWQEKKASVRPSLIVVS